MRRKSALSVINFDISYFARRRRACVTSPLDRDFFWIVLYSKLHPNFDSTSFTTIFNFSVSTMGTKSLATYTSTARGKLYGPYFHFCSKFIPHLTLKIRKCKPSTFPLFNISLQILFELKTGDNNTC